MSAAANLSQRYSVHGLPLELSCDVDWLRPPLAHVFDPFLADDGSSNAEVITGSVHAYDRDEVASRIPPNAQRVPWPHESIEIYEDAERFFLIDDRWGVAEMNLRKARWRSWIIPQPLVDPIRCAEFGVLWPLAQIARARDFHLMPAASVAFDDRAFLLLAPFSIESELCELTRAGYRIVAQSWTPIREHSRGFDALYLPGQVQRAAPPQIGIAGEARPTWIDLMDARASEEVPRASCDTVLLIEPARRPSGYLKPIPANRALKALRDAWPLPQLHPHRRHGQLPLRLAQGCACYETCLSRRASDFPRLVDSLHGRHRSVKRPDPATFSISRRVAV